MMLLPHTLTIYPVGDRVVSQTVKGREKPAGFTVRASLQPMSAEAAFTRLGVELRNPHRAYLRLADADEIEEGFLVEFDGRQFFIRGIERWLNNVAPHAVLLLEETENQL